MLRRITTTTSSSSLFLPSYSSVASSLFVSVSRTIVIPRQLKAYGDNFAPTHRQTQTYLVPHNELTEVAKLSNKSRSTSTAKPVATFEEMYLPQSVHAALDELGVAVPSPIQQSAIPVIVARETNSVIVASPNGTGKTLSYLAPLFASLVKDRDVYKIPLREFRPRAIIFAPTQELIWQIHNVVQTFCKHTGLTSVAFTSTRRNNRKWRLVMRKAMPDIVVMGPSLALRAVETHRLFLDDLRHVVLDEADELVAPSSTRLGSRFVTKVTRRLLYRHLWPVNTQALFVTSGITRDLSGYIKRKHGAAVPAVVGSGMHLPSRTSRHRFMLLQKEEHKLDALMRVLMRGGWYPNQQFGRVDGDNGGDAAGAGHEEQDFQGRAATDRAKNKNSSPRPRGGPDLWDKAVSPEAEGKSSSSSSRSVMDDEADNNDKDDEEVILPGAMRESEAPPSTHQKQIVLRWEFQSTTPAPFTTRFAAPTDATGRERRVIIFFNKIDRCSALFHKLRERGFNVAILHAELPIEVRRENFKNWATASPSQPRILCTTDIAARGLDVDVTSVINFDVPAEAGKYLNRAGRCARMGRQGSVVSLYTKKQRVIVSVVKSFIKKDVPLEGVHNWSDHMQKPSYGDFRTQRIHKLFKKYVSLITRRTVPAHLEKVYTKHVATWRPIWHPNTAGDHGGVPVRQQKKLQAKIMEAAIWHRRAKLAKHKGGSAKFGRTGKQGQHGTATGSLGIRPIGGADPQKYASGYDGRTVGPPEAPPRR